MKNGQLLPVSATVATKKAFCLFASRKSRRDDLVFDISFDVKSNDMEISEWVRVKDFTVDRLPNPDSDGSYDCLLVSACMPAWIASGFVHALP